MVLENGALQVVGVEVIIGTGVVCDKTLDCFDTDFCPAIGVGISYRGEAMVYSPVLLVVAGGCGGKFRGMW